MTNEELIKKVEELEEIGEGFDYPLDEENLIMIRIELVKIADTEYFFIGGYASPGVLVYAECWEEEDIIKAVDSF